MAKKTNLTVYGRAIPRLSLLATLALVFFAQAAAAQTEPKSPVDAMRNKISAGDIRSAESLLEIYRQQHGEGNDYIHGLGWLSRGALLVGEPEKARHYASLIRELTTKNSAPGQGLADNRYLRSSYGTALEVEAQLIEEKQGPAAAAKFLEGEIAAMDPDLVALRSRLYKRVNLLTLEGNPALDLATEDFIGDPPPTLQTLRGQPFVLFVWAEWCGDCESQAPLLARARRMYEERGLKMLTLTRYYDDVAERASEKARVESVWKDVYEEVGAVPMLVSTASMERYGGASTPTYVFVDRTGVVSDYLPYRLTEQEFDRRVKKILD